MSKENKRGYLPEDEKEFKDIQLEKLHNATEELYYLLNRGYQTKNASTFIGNHYMLSERQRLALARTVSSSSHIKLRKEKQIVNIMQKQIENEIENEIDKQLANNNTINGVNIDGFNSIITLEVALSGSLLLECMDGSIRDLAGLRGTYRMIDKTEIAVNLILKWLDVNQIQKANIYLDAPVSNSGRLKTMIAESAEKFAVKINIEVINNVDSVLEKMPFVISSDAIILNKCQNWINMNKDIIDNDIKETWKIRLF